MQVKQKYVDCRGKDWLYFLDHGDDHRMDVCYTESLQQEDLDWAWEKKALLLLKGDKFNATTPDDKRYEHRNVDKRYRDKRFSDAMQLAVKDHVKMYQPFADSDLIIGAVDGNHENTLTTRHHIDMHTQFLDKLYEDRYPAWEEYHPMDLGYRALIALKFRVTNTRVNTFCIFAWHGNGFPRTRPARMTRLMKLAEDYHGINYFTVGHWHDRFFWPDKSTIGITSRGKPKLQAHTTYYGMSGTYLKGMMEGHDGYPDKMAYPACELGGLRLKINPRTLEMKEAD